ncbi:MAG: hypothetical protein GX443_18370 [Deltaproteobacteria bacterium]|nr:hypothetical protein [Deltaproteobacteria bacterium]
MKACSLDTQVSCGWRGPPVALFWDQSLVWGIFCLETMDRLGIPYRLLRGDDISAGALAAHRVLLVPGGWAAHKLHALGREGSARIRCFVEEGGGYLGFCGGAGLALSSHPSIKLVPVERIPLCERLPSASGEVWIQGHPHHPAWKNIPAQIPVSVWWPSQFRLTASEGIRLLATYSGMGKDFRVADLPVSDLMRDRQDMEEWERAYGINLDPSRLLGQPAILEARLGRGSLVLSYPHLETPEDTWGNLLFRNLLLYLDRSCSETAIPKGVPERNVSSPGTPPTRQVLRHAEVALKTTQRLIHFGERHLLWNWRNPWLLNWRRGIRGLEYGTLAVSLAFLYRELEKVVVEEGETSPWIDWARETERCVLEFCDRARCLLLEEKLSAYSGKLPKLGKVNPRVDALRSDLFGGQMSHGGLFRKVFDSLDLLLFHTLLWTRPPQAAP